MSVVAIAPQAFNRLNAVQRCHRKTSGFFITVVFATAVIFVGCASLPLRGTSHPNEQIMEEIYSKSGIRVIKKQESETWQKPELETLNEVLDILPNEYKTMQTIYLQRGNRKSDKKKRIIYIPHPGPGKQTLKRHFAQELTRFLDLDRKISESWEWRKISRWTGWDILGNRAENKNAHGFATPQGRKNPEQDLVTTAGMFFVPPEYKNSMQYLKCRLPSKYNFLKNLFVSKPDPQNCVKCQQTYKNWIDPGEVEQVELLIASPSFASIASVAGHILLLVRKKGDIAGLSTAVGFVARPLNKKGKRDTGFTYMFRGIFGYYRSKLQIETLASVLKRYTINEDRNIYRLKLKLSESQIETLICRLWEINRTFTYKYYFFNKNCTTMFVNLIDYVLPEEQRLRERDNIDLPLNVGSELYLKGLVEFVYPEYWSLSRQAKFAVLQNKRIKDKIITYYHSAFPGEIAAKMERYLRETLSSQQGTRMAAYPRVFSLYSGTSHTVLSAKTRDYREKQITRSSPAACFLPASNRSPDGRFLLQGIKKTGDIHELAVEGKREPLKDFYSHGKLLLKYLMNARTREKYLNILTEKKKGKYATGKNLLNDKTMIFPLVNIILKLRFFLGQYINSDVLPIYDELEQEFTDYVIQKRRNRSYNCGYSPIFISPQLTCYKNNIFLESDFRISTFSQEMGDNSVFSLGCDTYLDFFTFNLSYHKVFERTSGLGREKKPSLDMDFTFLEYEKILISKKADYSGWLNYGFGLSLFCSYQDRWRNIKRDTSLLSLKFLINILEKDHFKHFCTIALGCGYSYRLDAEDSIRHFMDVLLRMKGKIHLSNSTHSALRFSISYKPRLTFSSGFMSEFNGSIAIDWSPGARSNFLFTTGVSYKAEAYHFTGPGQARSADKRWSIYTSLRFKGKLLPGWLNPKNILNNLF